MGTEFESILTAWPHGRSYFFSEFLCFHNDDLGTKPVS